MASTISSSLLQTLTFRRTKTASPPLSAAIPNRRQLLFLSTTSLTAALTATKQTPANAQEIGLFGIRKRIEKAEEEAKEIIIEGIETAEKGIETAEKGIETAEEEIEMAAVGFGGVAQAGVVLGAEFVGVLAATTVVNGILGPEAKNL